jgi:hypothetical protein
MAKVATIKTKETTASVQDYLDTFPDEQKRKDSQIIVKLMEKATKDQAKMWGSSIIGFGNKRYKSPATGREVDWFKIGFAPRKSNITLYLIGGLAVHKAAMKKLGKHKVGGGCLYINKLSDVDIKVLEQMINVTAKAS